jgi:hypothetical protein
VMELMRGRREGVWLRVARREDAWVADDKWIVLYRRGLRYVFHSVLTRRNSVVSRFKRGRYEREFELMMFSLETGFWMTLLARYSRE